MGKLIKNHWARLIILVASTYQIAASVYAFFWPKLFFDFLTTNLDGCVRPVPILQIINLLLGLLGLAWEWPLPLFTTASTWAGISYRNAARKQASSVTAAGASTTTTTMTRDTTKAGLQASVVAAAVERNGRDKSAAGAGGAEQENVTRERVYAVLAGMHRSIEARLMVYPLSSLAALLLYQATNAGLYYIIGMGVYFWAFSEGEVVMGVPWTLPRRGRGVGGIGRV